MKLNKWIKVLFSKHWINPFGLTPFWQNLQAPALPPSTCCVQSSVPLHTFIRKTRLFRSPVNVWYPYTKLLEKVFPLKLRCLIVPNAILKVYQNRIKSFAISARQRFWQFYIFLQRMSAESLAVQRRCSVSIISPF